MGSKSIGTLVIVVAGLACAWAAARIVFRDEPPALPGPPAGPVAADLPARRPPPPPAEPVIGEGLRALSDAIANRQRSAETGPSSASRPARDPKHDAAADVDHDLERARRTLHDGDPGERIGVVTMLAGAGGAESLRLLLDTMNDPAKEVRLQVVLALRSRSEEARPEWLTPALRDSDPEVRFEAVTLLGDIDTPAAKEAARPALEDPDEDVRTAARGVLGVGEDEEPSPEVEE